MLYNNIISYCCGYSYHQSYHHATILHGTVTKETL